ncbi:MAG: nitrophenyl compound nitroreductase subunit ArsF family protein [Candidatus Zixiibacteriota bacterium]
MTQSLRSQILIAAVLLLAATAVVLAAETKKAEPLTKPADSSKTAVVPTHQVVAYYFHGNVRCASCLKIEAYTREAIDSAFAAELKDNRLVWRVINTDSTCNEHYLSDYKLFTKSVVLSDLHNGKETRWQNLEKVWELLNDQALFHAYICDELTPYMDSTR